MNLLVFLPFLFTCKSGETDCIYFSSKFLSEKYAGFVCLFQEEFALSLFPPKIFLFKLAILNLTKAL